MNGSQPVDPKTVTRWANTGKLPCLRTVGGWRRYLRADVDAVLAGQRLHVLPLTDAELQAAGDMLVKVLDRGRKGPLTDEEALPLFTLLRALPGGEAK
jgi:hypothetical protein